MRDRALVILSGGLDSTVTAYEMAVTHELDLLSFDYGQRHRRELESAVRIAALLNSPHAVLDLRGLRSLLPGSALTDDAVPVPLGHYEAESMKQTVVPNRNAIMLAIAWARAVAIGAECVAYGAHAGDHAIYPDCRPEFYEAAERAFVLGNLGFGRDGLRLVAPFGKVSKAAVVSAGAALGVPFEETWSCYQGGDVHCGRCGTCVERREAFALAGIVDPTAYLATA
jgi:7-cyano-7-deazaguanine synthase